MCAAGLVAYLIPCVDHDVRATQELGDGGRVTVEQTLASFWHTIAAPVDLDKLGQLALGWCFSDTSVALASGTLRLDPSRARKRIATCLKE